MIEKRVMCDIDKKDCTDEPYGASFGRIDDPAKHIHVHLCKFHYEMLLNAIADLLDSPNGPKT